MCALGSPCPSFTKPSSPQIVQTTGSGLGQSWWRKGRGACQLPRVLERGQPPQPGPSPQMTLSLPTVPPVIETGLSDVSTTEGSHTLLPCSASGSPEPTITWEKDGQPVSGAEGKFTLQPSGELLVKNLEVRPPPCVARRVY